ncbi:transposase [Algibacillus agarilyticus]|uniref:transposase n=1 Tax=Algibacillus agarilyticus TaxID=2234133 RepID=UPI000DD0905F|nr:transposase [Algibacillus agarilyticus]
MSYKFIQEFKIQAVQKALNQRGHVNLKEMAIALNVGYSTLQKWIKLAKDNQLDALPSGNDMKNEKRPQDWSPEARLNAIIACAALGDEGINQYCRAQGIYPHHVQQWKQDITQVAVTTTHTTKTQETKCLKNEIKQLQKELNRKDKALAETAALWALKKKADAIWGSREDD